MSMQTSDERLCVRILLVCMVVQAALALMYALTLRYELKTSGLDGMVYAQLFHNLLEGRGFVSSINPPFVPQHWMGIHFSPILFLMTPFYWLFPHIETFLVIGAVALAAAAWPVYLTARHILDNAGHALIIAFLYLFNPFVFNAIVWDFHEIDFAPLCIAWMLWAVVKKKRYTLLALGAVLMCIKEHYGLAVAGFGALWAWHWRERKLGIWLAIDGLAIMLLIFVIVIPMFNPLGKPMMMNEASPLDRFSWLTSVDSIRHYAWPMLLAALAYAGHLLVPYLLLPLVSCVWLLPGIADIAVNTLAQTPMMRSPLSYHSAALVPVILVALCMSIKTLFHGRTRISANDSMLPIVVVALSYSYMQLALPFSDTGNTWEFGEPQISYTPEDNKAVQAIRGMIPPNAIVTAQENVLPHLNPQHEMYPFPERLTDATYVVLHLKFPYENAANIFGTPYGMSGDRFFSYVDTLLADRNWKTVWSDRQWLVLQKDGVENLGARHAAQKNLEGARKAYRSAYERVTGVAPSS